MIELNTNACPTPTCAPLYRVVWMTPTREAPKAEPMNRPTLTRSTGMPVARALTVSPPTAKIQLPYLLMCRTQPTTTITMTHQMMATSYWSLISEPNIVLAQGAESTATLVVPVITRLRPRV